jgi:hypothetical protein
MKRKKTIVICSPQDEEFYDLSKWGSECPKNCVRKYYSVYYQKEKYEYYFFVDKKTDLMQGEYIAYYPDGALLFKRNCCNGSYVGYSFLYEEDGRIYEATDEDMGYTTNDDNEIRIMLTKERLKNL